jgi:ABC-2 type transport system permease protein
VLASRSLALIAPAASPFLAYLRLEVRRAFRNRRYLVFTLVFPLALYVLYTAILPVGGPGTLDGLAWNAYFMVSMACYGAIGAAMSQAAPIAIERQGGWARQLRVTPLPGLAYVLAKVVSALILTVPALVLVMVAGAVINHVELGVTRVAGTVGVLALASAPFAALAVVLGYSLDADSAQGGMVLAYFTLAILGGLFAPLESFPPLLATIGHVLPSSHLASVGRAVAAGSVPALADIAVLVAWTVALGSIAAWRYLRDEQAGRA